MLLAILIIVSLVLVFVFLSFVVLVRLTSIVLDLRSNNLVKTIVSQNDCFNDKSQLLKYLEVIRAHDESFLMSDDVSSLIHSGKPQQLHDRYNLENKNDSGL